MGNTYRKRDNIEFRRFQRAMRVDTSLKARRYREREAGEEQAALDAWHSRQRYLHRPAPVRQLMEAWHEAQSEG